MFIQLNDILKAKEKHMDSEYKRKESERDLNKRTKKRKATICCYARDTVQIDNPQKIKIQRLEIFGTLQQIESDPKTIARPNSKEK